jgi:phosphate transport system protein
LNVGEPAMISSGSALCEPQDVLKFVEGLDQLRTKLLEMSSLVEMGILRSVHAAVHKDRSAAEEVLKNEARINSIELEIDRLAFDLLALHQPMGRNLRFIVAALKINTDLERMGDLSVNIAVSAQSLIDATASAVTVDIPIIAGLVQSMVRKSMDALVAGDVELAREVLKSDDAVDTLRTACYQELIGNMEKGQASVKPGLSLLAVTRNLERLADHATNIAEDVLFYVKGIDVRHNSEIGERR